MADILDAFELPEIPTDPAVDDLSGTIPVVGPTAGQDEAFGTEKTPSSAEEERKPWWHGRLRWQDKRCAIDRWYDINWENRHAYCTFDDKHEPKLPIPAAWVFTVLQAMVLALPPSLGYICASLYPPAGFNYTTAESHIRAHSNGTFDGFGMPPPTWSDHVAFDVLFCLLMVLFISQFTFGDPQLTDWKLLCFQLVINAIFLGLKIPFEALTGFRSDTSLWVWNYNFFFLVGVYGLFGFAYMFPCMAARMMGDPLWWFAPKHRVNKALADGFKKGGLKGAVQEAKKFLPIAEIKVQNLMMGSIFAFYIPWIYLDLFVFTNSRIEWSSPLLKSIVRPLFGYTCMRLLYAAFCKGFSMTGSPPARTQLMMIVQQNIAQIGARLTAGCPTWTALCIRLVLSWFFLLTGRYGFWLASAPKQPPPIKPKMSKELIAEAERRMGQPFTDTAWADFRKRRNSFSERRNSFSERHDSVDGAAPALGQPPVAQAQRVSPASSPQKARPSQVAPSPTPSTTPSTLELSSPAQRPRRELDENTDEVAAAQRAHLQRRRSSFSLGMTDFRAEMVKYDAAVAAYSAKRARLLVYRKYAAFMTFDKVPPMQGMVKRDYRSYEIMQTSMAVMTASAAYLIGYGYFQLTSLPESWPPYRLWFPQGARSALFVAIGLLNSALQDLFTHWFLRKAAERHPKPTCHLRTIAPGLFHRSWDLFLNYFVQSFTSALAVGCVSMTSFFIAQMGWW